RRIEIGWEIPIGDRPATSYLVRIVRWHENRLRVLMVPLRLASFCSVSFAKASSHSPGFSYGQGACTKCAWRKYELCSDGQENASKCGQKRRVCLTEPIG